MNIKAEVIDAIKAYVKQWNRRPDRLHISLLRAIDFCELTENDIGFDAVSTIMLDGPVAFLDDWGFLGLKPVWLKDVCAIGIAVSHTADNSEQPNGAQQHDPQRNGRRR